MADGEFLDLIERWLSDEPSRFEVRRRALLAWWWRRPAARFTKLGMFQWFLRLVLVASAPLIMHLTGAIDRVEALAVAGWLFALQAASDVISTYRARRRDNPSSDSREIIIRVNDLMSSVASDATSETFRDDSITASLALIEWYARHVTRSRKGSVAVSLVLYESGERERMILRHRDPSSERPRPRTFGDLDRLFGHHACRAGPAPRRVNDVRKFGSSVRSPTQSEVNYRSIFILPIKALGSDSSDVVGFVSIDCTRPYAFFGRYGDDIARTCVALLDHLQSQIR